METKQSLSHETATLPEFSLEGKTALIDVLKTLFAENRAADVDYIENYWEMLNSAIRDSDPPPHIRQCYVLDTQQNIKTIKVLYSLFKELNIY